MALRDHVDDVEPSFLIGVGTILFLIPEPASSALGLGMILLGVVWWFDEWRENEV